MVDGQGVLQLTAGTGESGKAGRKLKAREWTGQTLLLDSLPLGKGDGCTLNSQEASPRLRERLDWHLKTAALGKHKRQPFAPRGAHTSDCSLVLFQVCWRRQSSTISRLLCGW